MFPKLALGNARRVKSILTGAHSDVQEYQKRKIEFESSEKRKTSIPPDEVEVPAADPDDVKRGRKDDHEPTCETLPIACEAEGPETDVKLKRALSPEFLSDTALREKRKKTPLWIPAIGDVVTLKRNMVR